MATTPTGFDVARCLQAARAIEADLDDLTTKLTEAQFQAPPREGGWSVGHCIEHLVLTGEAFINRWDSAIATSGKNVNGESHRSPYSWWQRMMLNAFEPPYKIKTKTTKPFAPSARRSMAETLQRFATMHREVTRRIERSRTLDTSRIPIRSPFASWMSYPLGFSFDLALVHERRHLWQARQLRREFENQ